MKNELPNRVLEFLNTKAKEAGHELLENSTNLFNSGVLDSFTLVDLVTQIEESMNVRIPDYDVRIENFESVDAIEDYLSKSFGD